MSTCLLLLAIAFQDAPKYRYEFFVEPAKPGATVYAYLDRGPSVPICRDALAVAEVEKSTAAKDTAGLRELIEAGRLEFVPNETELRVLQYRADPRSYEVRVAAGPLKDRKGWVLASCARKRVSADAPAAKKARPKRKR